MARDSMKLKVLTIDEANAKGYPFNVFSSMTPEEITEMEDQLRPKWRALDGRIIKARDDGQLPGAENDIRIGEMAEWFADYLNRLEKKAEVAEVLASFHRRIVAGAWDDDLPNQLAKEALRAFEEANREPI